MTTRSRSATERLDADPGLDIVEPTRRRRWAPPRWVVRTLLVFLASRVLIAVAVLMSIGIRPPAEPGNLLQAWDGFWYLHIAQHGYPTNLAPYSPGLHYNALAFFPLWPLAIRGGGALLGGHPVLAAYLLNFLFGAVLAVLVRMVFARVSDDRTADLGVTLFVFFPGTVVFSGAYSEPLALCLAAGALLALMRHQWVLAGVCAAFAGATRPPIAVAVFAAVAWAVFAAARRREWRSLVALPLAPLGLLAFILYGWVHTGDPLAWHKAEDYFGNKMDFGRSFFSTVIPAISKDVRDPLTGMTIVVVLSMAILLILAIFYLRRPPPALLTVYTVVAVLLPGINSALMPKARFLAAAFPLLLPLAAYLREKGREQAVGVVLASEGGLLVGFTLMHVLARMAFP